MPARESKRVDPKGMVANLFVYVIAWFAVVFGINSTCNAVNCTQRKHAITY